MNNRILITYATRTGSTAEVADAIGEVLASRGFVVDIKPMKEKPSLDRYNAVVLGSAIRLGSWLTESLDFIKENQAGAAEPNSNSDLHRAYAEYWGRRKQPRGQAGIY